MSTCSAAEIAEKKRAALAKLHAKQQQTKQVTATVAQPPVAPSSNSQSSFKNALKAMKHATLRELGHISTHPYQRPTESKSQLTLSPKIPEVAPVFANTISCRVYMISAQRFAVQPSGYHEKLIDVFKKMPTRSYNNDTRIWNFKVDDYQALQKHVGDLKPNVVIGTIPKKILDLCQEPIKSMDRSCLASIEPKLADQLMPFQQEGVCFAIAQCGRIMICDEMGLGKTYQALAVADFYREDWPLLICTTASTRDSWARHVSDLLPRVPLPCVQVLANTQQYVCEAKVLITSYNMMERHVDKLLARKFGFLIFDESHTLKSGKAKCTAVAKRLAEQAKHVILLSGTPALSRPLELFTQLQLVDSRFMSYIEYTTRYCDGKQTHFGWDANGQSNLDELKIVLTRKYMIRRTKAEVLPQLAEKNRETVVLDPTLVATNDETKSLNEELQKSKGKFREEILLRFYARTAEVKARAVCHYLKTLVKQQIKFIIFAHHRVMMDAISECLEQLKIHYIRIDGQTRSDLRAELVDTFQKRSACKAAVLSLKACNSGITLTAAELIVFAELDWNPSTLAQAESRAHRIGQTKPVVCRYLMASNTADDTIWNMLKNKQDVLSKVGIFCENLQEATHSAAPTTSRKLDEYFSPNKAVTSESNNNNNINEKPTKPCDKEIAQFFNDDDEDDIFSDLIV